MSHSPSLSRTPHQRPQHRLPMHTSTTFTAWTSSIPSSPSVRRRLSLPLLSRLRHRTSKRSLGRSTPRFPTTLTQSLSHQILAVKSFLRSRKRRTGLNGARITSRPLRVHTNDSNARTSRTQAYRSTGSIARSSSRAETSSTQHSTSSRPPSPSRLAMSTHFPTPSVDKI